MLDRAAAGHFQLKTTGMMLIGVLLAMTPARAAERDLPEVNAPPPTTHQERPEDAPTVPAAALSQGMTVSRNGFTSVQVNVSSAGFNIVGDAANEPSLAVDPTDPQRMVVGWRQFDSIGSNFRQAGYAYSHDGGATWTFPGVLEPGIFRSDPVLGASADGVIYYNSLTSDFLCQFFRSFDGGVTWGPAISAFGGDKAWFAIDRTTGPGRGNIYFNWQIAAGCCGSRLFTRSFDDALTFTEPIDLPLVPRFGTNAVGSDGALYITGSALSAGAAFLRSTDAADPLATPEFAVITQVDMGGLTRIFAGPNPSGLLGQMYVDVDRSGGPRDGHVYMLGSVDPPGSDPLDVMFVRSVDGGNTWSSPIRVNTDPQGTNAWQWFGTLSVAPSGRIDVVWNDTRADPTVTESELYYASSFDGGLTWSPNIALTPPFDHSLGYPNQNKLGDYYHMVSDNLGADLAYAATFNGEQDVYYLRIGGIDCNTNGIEDHADIVGLTSLDCNTNQMPDECEFDCTSNGIPDDCDVLAGLEPDCNSDWIPDGCQLGVNDCDSNGFPDDCQAAALIVVPPADASVCPGGTTIFSVVVVAQVNSFQWQRNGVDLVDGAGVSGSQSSQLQWVGVDPADAGEIRCVVNAGCLVAESDEAALVVLESPNITQSPPLAAELCGGGLLLLNVEASGTAPLSYTWRKDGLVLGAPNQPSLAVNNLGPDDEGRYDCVVTNLCGSAVTTATDLVVINTVIDALPANQCVAEASTVGFTIQVTSPLTLNYAWRKDGALLTTTTVPSLVLTNVTSADDGEYTVVPFTVPDPVCLTFSDPFILRVGGCSACATPGDFDADGDRDLADWHAFQQCFGATTTPSGTCACANIDDTNDDVDLADWQRWVDEANGPAGSP